MSTTVTLTVMLDNTTAKLLGHTSMRNLYPEQADRFEVLSGEDAPQPDDVVFGAGTMTWCATASDALLLSAYERASGFHVALLWEVVPPETAVLTGMSTDDFIVLSSRPWCF